MYLFENDISDFVKSADGKNIGIVSAFRSAHKKKENMRRTKELQTDLDEANLSYVRLIGHYTEDSQDDPSKEVSFLVFAKNKDDDKSLKKTMNKLGAKYNQDSIIFKPFDSDSATLIGTSSHDEDGEKIDFPGFGKKVELGKFTPDKMGEYYSKMKGRCFVFESVFKPFSFFVKNMDGE